ncbi:hypothetical protein JYU14_03190, partial [Simkania negevensis]|nr:hypothetical protein [Simkania negevensis]
MKIESPGFKGGIVEGDDDGYFSDGNAGYDSDADECGSYRGRRIKLRVSDKGYEALFSSRRDDNFSSKGSGDFFTKNRKLLNYRTTKGDWTRGVLADLSLEEGLGQLCYVSYSPLESGLEACCHDFGVGGVIVHDTRLEADLDTQCQLKKASRLPLDTICLLDGPLPHWPEQEGSFPSLATLLAIPGTDLLYQWSKELAIFFHSLGVYSFAFLPQSWIAPRRHLWTNEEKVRGFVNKLQEGGVIVFTQEEEMIDGIGHLPFLHAHLAIHSLHIQERPFGWEMNPVLINQDNSGTSQFGGLAGCDLSVLPDDHFADLSRLEDSLFRLMQSKAGFFITPSQKLPALHAALIRLVKNGRVSEQEIWSKVERILLRKEWIKLHEASSPRTTSSLLRDLNKTIYRHAIVLNNPPLLTNDTPSIGYVQVDGEAHTPFYEQIKKEIDLPHHYFPSNLFVHSEAFNNRMRALESYDIIILAHFNMEQHPSSNYSIDRTTETIIKEFIYSDKKVIFALFWDAHLDYGAYQNLSVLLAHEESTQA